MCRCCSIRLKSVIQETYATLILTDRCACIYLVMVNRQTENKSSFIVDLKAQNEDDFFKLGEARRALWINFKHYPTPTQSIQSTKVMIQQPLL